jgi:hypothetical protein
LVPPKLSFFLYTKIKIKGEKKLKNKKLQEDKQLG